MHLKYGDSTTAAALHLAAETWELVWASFLLQLSRQRCCTDTCTPAAINMTDLGMLDRPLKDLVVAVPECWIHQSWSGELHYRQHS